MINYRRFVTLFLALTLAACGMLDNKIFFNDTLRDVAHASDAARRNNGFVASETFRAAKPGIDEQYARVRSSQVRHVDYQLSVDLTSSTEYQGTAQIQFELLRNDIPLTIDFTGGKVQRVSLNGNVIDYRYNGWFITVDLSALKVGLNTITVEYRHPYSNSGSGLYRFVDSEDGRRYVYSNFEPYDANRLFPSFDQPDLKASYKLDVQVPASWQVISSVREDRIVHREAIDHWYFPRSARFSTYVFSLHAGEYAVWESNAEGIPLRLFARQSLANYVVPGDWFDDTRHGFAFFQNYFEVDYPFLKYDQVIVPDFNAGAMENVAAVTFSERYIKRGAYTQNDRDRISGVILHEMAHMWFGNLVTMRWWNGLWLNESFATYMSYLAEASSRRGDRAWLRFFLRYKLWAYSSDEQVTTHAIELPVEDSASAFANFDGITYGKGASVLKQLSFLLGQDDFRRGVSRYLQQKAYDNSELADFINALAEASDKSLDDWSRQWLFEKGLNTVEADFDCNNGRVTSFELTQLPSAYSNELREHRLQVAAFRDGNLQSEMTQVLSGEVTSLTQWLGLPCPEFVYPNYRDWGYIKVQLPAAELVELASDLQMFDEPLVRAMLWHNLWESVRDARQPISAYADIVLSNIAGETQPDILLKVLRTVTELYAYYYAFDRQSAERLASFGNKYEQLAWHSVQTSTPGSDLQKFWFDSYVSHVRSAAGHHRLTQLLDGRLAIKGLVLDQDRRWIIVRQLSAHDHQKAGDILVAERQRDRSDSGRKALLAVRAATPDLQKKTALLAEASDMRSDRTLGDKKQIMRNLLQVHQRAASKQLLKAVLLPLPALAGTDDHQFIRSYSRRLVRGYCEPASEKLLRAAIADNLHAPLNVRKALQVALEEDRRCMSIKKADR